MKKLILICLCLVMVSNVFAYNIPSKLSYRKDIQTCQLDYYDVNKPVEAINMIIKLGLCYWGFSQNSTYGTITGLMFGASGTISLIKITFY